jgi:acetyl esterase/lipase
MSPVDPFFAKKFELFEKVPADAGEMGWMSLIGAEYQEPLSEYQSPDVIVENRLIPGPQGEIPVRLYWPADAADEKLPGVVWFHGGAFMFGDLDMNEGDVTGRELAHRANAVIMSVDYRLVTAERKFPASQIDGLAATRWLRDNAAELGVDAGRIVISGASAGACLTGSVALQLRDAGELAGIRQLLIYPTLHNDLPQVSAELAAKLAEIPSQLAFSNEFMVWLNGQLGIELADPSFHCFPGDTRDLSGLPQTLIINSEYDTLRASGERYFEQLKAADIDANQLLAEGAIHGHLNWYPADCNIMDETLDMMTDFITKEN